MNNKIFKGIMPALITPVYEDNTIREDTVRNMIEHLIANGVNGFYICGSTGEGPALGEKSRMRMAEVAVDQVKGRVAVINHIGAPEALSAIRLAKHAEEIGCDAISSLAPNFYFSHADDEIVSYYKALSDNCRLPLLVYATDLFNRADVSPLIDRLMHLDTVIGLKFTRFNYYEMHKISELNKGNINVINGPDEMLICGLTMGADAGIGSTYNLMPKQYVELYNMFTAGDYNGAREMQFKINRIISILIKYNCLASIKHVLNYKGFDVGNTVFPGKRFTKEDGDSLIHELTEAGFFENFWN